MKKTIIAGLIVMMVAGIALARPEGIPDDADRLYKFNIIGMKNPKNDMDQGAGKVIFVNLNEPSKINLVCSDDPEVLADYPELEAGSFDILDKDATDSDPKDPESGAVLALPYPGLEPYVVGETPVDSWSDYSIYIRSLGKPGGWAEITTCADVVASELADFLSPKIVKTILNDPGAFGGYASVESVGQEITERPKGKSVFTNVTAQLLTIVLKIELDIDGDGSVDETVYVRVPIFDEILENEYWEYDNHGLKNLQVWIYNNSTDVSEADEDLPPIVVD